MLANLSRLLRRGGAAEGGSAARAESALKQPPLAVVLHALKGERAPQRIVGFEGVVSGVPVGGGRPVEGGGGV